MTSVALYCDKYRPKTFQELDYHQDLTLQLMKLLQSPLDIPHLCFYGPNGSGKKTRIHCFLRELFSPSVDKLKIDQKVFKTPSGKSLEITILNSIHHLEINPSDVGPHDRIII